MYEIVDNSLEEHFNLSSPNSDQHRISPSNINI